MDDVLAAAHRGSRKDKPEAHQKSTSSHFAALLSQTNFGPPDEVIDWGFAIS